jgi:spore coat polysaccharide biosynthesis predicted glycosyltransferase SpsG
MKKIIFRADGNNTTGLGHLYRIFALIEIYKENFEFILLTKENSTLSAIPSIYNYKLIPNSISIEEEPTWLSKNYSSNSHLIIADGYQFNSKYQKELKNFNYQLVYVDDQIKEIMYADIVINHALSVKSSDYKSQPYTKFALGTSYRICLFWRS